MVNTAITAIMASLSAGPAVAAQIDRVRMRPLAKTVLQAVIVRPLKADVGELSLAPGYPVSWNTAVAVECYAKSVAGTAPDEAVDTLIGAVYARLMADITLGGAVIALQPQQIDYDFDVDGEQTTCATFVFNVFQRANDATLN